MADLITRIKKTVPTDDKIKQDNGTGVSQNQKNSDLSEAIKIGQSLLPMSKLVSIDKADADTAAQTGNKYKFDLKKAPSMAVDLKNAHDKLMSIAPRAKAYQATGIWDTKNKLSIARRFSKLRDLIQDYLDGNDKKMLENIQKIRGEMLLDKLISLGNELDSLGLRQEADIVDDILKTTIAKLS